jgi:cyclomaltodextrinase / maltogenic alpha-amylase / neopullulanase
MVKQCATYFPGVSLLIFLLIGGLSVRAQTTGPHYANSFDTASAGRYESREQDWRNGAVVYQVLVDRFAPAANLEAKRALYPAPKVLRDWDQPARRGTYSEQHKLWTHEIDFWGGDLASTVSKLDYIKALGADVLYLNPIHLAYTNHKYDALDYHLVSPEFGTRDDVLTLALEVKARNMRLVLDGVFNHMGRNSAAFKAAEASAQSPYRQWFVMGPQFPGGARSWYGAQNIPELNIENAAVRDHVFNAPDSVVRRYLRDGVDGWRLDVAWDIGFRYLDELTRAAHAEKPGSLVVGEIPNYPKEWFPALDGVLQFGLRALTIKLANRELDPQTYLRMVNRLITDTDYEHLLKSWVYLDNHDTPRVATTITDRKARQLAQVLQFTLPGSANLYYGSEVAMEGGDDPETRSPMRWDRVVANHPDLAWTKTLIGLRRAHRALRIGDFRVVEASGNVVAFERYTDRVIDSALVVVNPSLETVTTTLMVPNSKWMDGATLTDQLSGEKSQTKASLTTVKIPPQTARLFKLDTAPSGDGYSPFKRVQ